MVWPFTMSTKALAEEDYEYETDSQGSIEIEEYVEVDDNDEDPRDANEDDDDDDVEYELGGDKEVIYTISDDEDDETDDNYEVELTQEPDPLIIPSQVVDEQAVDPTERLGEEQTTTITPTVPVALAVPEEGPIESIAEPEPSIIVNDSVVEPDDSIATSSFQEKQSLLALAAEHDRVDILKGILSEYQDRDTLLHSGIPPLHVAVAYGSTNATSCLLRMGANPSIRPDIKGKAMTDGMDKASLKYHNVTAWELAFGRDESPVDDSAKGTWFGMTGAQSLKPTINMPPSKREGIRHAFTAEALRCIGADEHTRLAQLLQSGMPADIDIGGRTLHGWCMEMGSKNCQILVGKTEEQDPIIEEQMPEPTSPTKRHTSFQGDDNDVTKLTNRLEELESLASALSACLDNLAEEVSVCHGLLLLGGGGSALASHVRSLKELMTRRHEELQGYSDKWNHAEEDVEILIEQCGADETLLHNSQLFRRLSSRVFPTEPLQLQAHIGASENKVRKLRASIADMSEENTMAIIEVEKKGLSGGINLVRGLREELRELEFQLSAAKSGEAACRVKIQLLQAKLDDRRANLPIPKETPAEVGVDIALPSYLTKEANQPLLSLNDEDSDISDPDQPKASTIIVNGKSKQLMLHQTTGYMPLNIWFILLRIIGLGRVAVQANIATMKETATSSVMIV
jgi:hypothetical protein